MLSRCLNVLCSVCRINRTVFFCISLKVSVAELSEDEIRTIAATSNDQAFQRDLQTLVQPRIVGTQGHEAVKEYIVK